MDTIFSIKAHEWTQKSIDSSNQYKFFESWIDTIPAKLYYAADLISNIVMIPFSLTKTFFASLYYIYTWGHDAKNLNKALSELYNYANNSISSFVGMFATNFAKSIRNKNNVEALLSISLSVALVGLSILAILKAGGLEMYFNLKEGSWEPYFYWDFSKIFHLSH